MTKEKLAAYIEINHHFMTVQEMAEETKATYSEIAYICKKNNYKPITIRERVLEFINKNPHLSVDEQAKQLGLEKHALLHHYERAGIKPKTKREIKQESKNTLSKGAQEFIDDILMSCQPEKEVNRKAFTVYNQSGSDFLDEYRGIKTTKRNDKLIL